MPDKNDRGFIYPSPSCTEGDELAVTGHHKHPALAENTPLRLMLRCGKKQKLDEENEMEFIDRNLLP
jgi:hypothetical protein